MAGYSLIVQQAIDRERAARGLPPLPPDAANAVDAAIATPVGDQATAALADAAIATPLGAQIVPATPFGQPHVVDSTDAAPGMAALADSIAAANAPVAVAPAAVSPAISLPPSVAPEMTGVPSMAATEPTQPEPAPVAVPAPGVASTPAQEPAAEAVAPAAEAAQETADEDPAGPTTDLAPLSLEPSLTSAQSDMATIEREATGASQRIAEADEAAAKEREASSKKFLEDFDADMAKGMSEIEAAREGLKRNQEEVRAANDEIAKLPPIRDTRSGLEKVFGALTIAIGGMQDQNNLVAGLMQGMNVQTRNAEMASETVRNAVQRDIDLQKMNYDKARDKRDAKMTEYGIARQLLGDSQQALRFATAMRGERFAGEMEQQAATLKSRTARDAGILKSSEMRAGFRKEQNDLLQGIIGAKGAALQAIALGKMTPAQAAEFIGSGGTGDGKTPTAAELKEMERKRQADLLKLGGGNANQRGAGQIEDLESSYDDFSKTKPADWYNDDRTKKADAARSSYVQLDIVYSDAARALRTVKDPNASQDEKLDALTTYNEAREAVPQLLVAALGGGAAAEGEAARASKNWPTVPNPNLGDGAAGILDAVAKEGADKYWRGIDARPEAIEGSLGAVRRRHFAVMNELGHRHNSLATPQSQPAAGAATLATAPAAATEPAPAKPKRRLTAADL